MKSKTSFFNRTVFLKDVTRFAPVWILYLVVVGLGLITMLMDGYQWGSSSVELAYELSYTLEIMTVANFVYALVCCQLIFGDLFNARLCNALHAFPLRREGWFLTHCGAGLCFSIVPNLLLSLICIPFLQDFWFIAPLWLLASTLQFLFFFGVGVFSAVSTGNRFGMVLVYGLINLLAILVYWLIETFYAPLLHGIPIRLDELGMFSPLVWMATYASNLFDFQYQTSVINDAYYCQYVYQGLTSNWWYLVAITVVGLAFLGAALLLYRRRKLEKAGELVAFRFFSLPFSILMTLTAAAVFQLIDDVYFSTDTCLFLVVGLVLGCFGTEMLLRRTVKVFKKGTFLKLTAIGGIFGLSILLTALDPFGITQWTPEPEQVTSVTISNDYDYQDADRNHPSSSDRLWTITDPELIEEVVELHELILDEGSFYSRYGYRYHNLQPVFLRYQLKNGRVVDRRYYLQLGGEAEKALDRFYSAPPFQLSYPCWDDMLQDVYQAECIKQFPPEEAQQLLSALKEDYDASAQWANQEPVGKIRFYFYSHYRQEDGMVEIDLYPCCTRTLAWLRDHGVVLSQEDAA